MLRWGTGPAGGFAALEARWPDRPGLVDELGTLTFGEIHRRSNALAQALREQGVGEGDSVAVMCRNHRYFVDATIAAAKLGADILLLNTAFAGPQLVEVLEREGPGAVIHDEEFSGLLDKAETERRILAWTDGDDRDDTVEALIRSHPEHRPRPAGGSLASSDPDLGHHRHPQGRTAQRGGHRRGGRAARRGSRCGPSTPHAHRRTAVPHLGLRPPGPRDAAGHHRGAAAPLRPRGVPAADRGGAVPLGRGDPGDAAADHGAAEGQARQLRPLVGAGGVVVRVRAAGRPGDRVDGRVRRPPLQHLRLDRGGLRQHRHARRPACRARRRPASRRSAPW